MSGNTNPREPLHDDGSLEARVSADMRSALEQLLRPCPESNEAVLVDAAMRCLEQRKRELEQRPWLTNSASRTTATTVATLSDAEWAVIKSTEFDLDERETERLRQLDVWILDNSLRETTVAAVHSHTLDTKARILEITHQAGLDDVIVGTYGDVRRVDDVMPENYVEWGFGTLEHVWGLCDPWPCDPSELETVLSGRLSHAAGLDDVLPSGIGNVVIEINTCSPWWPYHSELGDMRKHLVAAIRRANRELPRRTPRPDEKLPLGTERDKEGKTRGRVMVNLRDIWKWMNDPNGMRRGIQFVKVVATMAPEERPYGLVCEDPSALIMPETLAAYVRMIRKTMTACGWTDGHLLVHVHCGFGNAQAATLKALANGATGIWGAVCRYGGQLGHAGSAMTLVNLARLGNQAARTKYNIPKIIEAAQRIHEIAAMRPAEPTEEVYGTQAFDMVFGLGGMSSDDIVAEIARDICGQPARVRVTTFATAEMIEQALIERIGPAAEFGWDPAVTHRMRQLILEGCINGLRWDYSAAAGLCQLYQAALPDPAPCLLPPKMLEAAVAGVGTHPLLKELKKRIWRVLQYRQAEKANDAHGMQSLTLPPAVVDNASDVPHDDAMPEVPLDLILEVVSDELADMSISGRTADTINNYLVQHIPSDVVKANKISYPLLVYIVSWPLLQDPEHQQTVEQLIANAHRCLVMQRMNQSVQGSGYFDALPAAFTKLDSAAFGPVLSCGSGDFGSALNVRAPSVMRLYNTVRSETDDAASFRNAASIRRPR